MVRTGIPFPIAPRSDETVRIVDATAGLNTSVPAVNAPLGATPTSDNYVVLDGAIEQRPTLSLATNTPQLLGNTPILGAFELQDTLNRRFPILSGQTNHEVYNQSNNAGAWSLVSYISVGGFSDPPALGNADYWDYAQIYSADVDENIAVMATGSAQSLYAYRSDTTVFSTLTGAPQARFVTSFDNYLLAFNVRQGGQDFPNRVQWCDRGDPSNWSTGLSGFEDLLSMRGNGTRAISRDNGIFLFSDEEIWRGDSASAPFTFGFSQYDSTRGCPYSWTIADTPLGTMFLGKDYQVYLLPKGGGVSRPVGQPLQRFIRQTIDNPDRAWAVFNNTYSRYELYYPILNGSGYPQRAAFLDLGTGAWMPQSFDSAGGTLSLSRGIEVRTSSSATTWGGAQQSGITWGGYQALGFTWKDLNGRPTGRAVLAGSSKGTAFIMDSNGTNDNGVAVVSRWQSGALLGDDPAEQKTVNELRIDYQGTSASSVTAQYSQDNGATFIGGQAIPMPAASNMSQGIGYPFFAARYPMFEVFTQGVRHRIARFQMKYVRGGR